MTVQPVRSCRIWCSFLVFALSLAYLPEWASLFASGPPAAWPATQHDGLVDPGDASDGVQQAGSGVGRALFQAKTGANASAVRSRGGRARRQASARRRGGSQQEGGGEASTGAGTTAAPCKVPEAVKPRRAGPTTVKPSAQKCRAACRCGDCNPSVVLSYIRITTS